MRGMYALRRRGVARRGGVCGRSRTRPPPPQELEDQRAEERNEDDVAREHHPARRPGLRQIVCSRRCRCSASDGGGDGRGQAKALTRPTVSGVAASVSEPTTATAFAAGPARSHEPAKLRQIVGS
jgi:hypothetical protein